MAKSPTSHFANVPATSILYVLVRDAKLTSRLDSYVDMYMPPPESVVLARGMFKLL